MQAEKIEQSEKAIMADFLKGFSLEVMPRTAEKIENFQDILPQNTRVYIAHIDGTPIEDMRKTAQRLHKEGFEVMPHFPARIIENATMLEDWIAQYAEIGVSSALVLAGGVTNPKGEYSDSMQLLASGLFDKYAYKRLHVAGHPEGNTDIDPKGGTSAVDAALQWKNDFAKNTDAKMAIATQFAFETAPILAWEKHLKSQGITLPIHIGIAGPAKLQTMIKFAMACGVGPSIRVLQRRAKDLTQLLLPYKPDNILSELALEKVNNPDLLIESVHVFPLGGIKASTDYVQTITKG